MLSVECSIMLTDHSSLVVVRFAQLHYCASVGFLCQTIRHTKKRIQGTHSLTHSDAQCADTQTLFLLVGLPLHPSFSNKTPPPLLISFLYKSVRPPSLFPFCLLTSTPHFLSLSSHRSHQLLRTFQYSPSYLPFILHIHLNHVERQ